MVPRPARGECPWVGSRRPVPCQRSGRHPTVGALVAQAASVPWPVSTLVVSEVQTGGGSASDEFVEIGQGKPGAAGIVRQARSGLRHLVRLHGHAQGGPGCIDQYTRVRQGGVLVNSAGSYVALGDIAYSGGFAATGRAIALRHHGGSSRATPSGVGGRDQCVRRGDGRGPRRGCRFEPRPRPGGTARQRASIPTDNGVAGSSRRHQVRQNLSTRRPFRAGGGTDPDADGDTDADGHSRADDLAYVDTHADARAHACADGVTDCDPDRHADTRGHAESESHSDPEPDSDTDPEPDSDTDPEPELRLRLRHPRPPQPDTEPDTMPMGSGRETGRIGGVDHQCARQRPRRPKPGTPRSSRDETGGIALYLDAPVVAALPVGLT